MLKIIIQGLLFGLSSGLLFSDRFRRNTPVVVVSGILAILSGLFTILQVIETVRGANWRFILTWLFYSATIAAIELLMLLLLSFVSWLWNGVVTENHLALTVMSLIFCAVFTFYLAGLYWFMMPH